MFFKTTSTGLKGMVADPGCLFRNPDLIFFNPISWILYSITTKMSRGKIELSGFFVAINFTKLKIVIL